MALLGLEDDRYSAAAGEGSRRTVDQVLEVVLPQLIGLEPKYEEQAIEHIGLPAAIGPYDAGNAILEGPDSMSAAVGLEVLQLEKADLHAD